MSQRTGGSTLRKLAEATPPSRDRYVDLLRAFSICVVVLGHWLIAIIYIADGKVTGENALHVVPGLWLATWVLQVMPLFFFVGGFSNLVTIDATKRRGGAYADFIHGRVLRLMKPTAVMLAFWIPISIGVDLLSRVGDRTLELATGVLTRPLWFIGIYLIMIALAPPMLSMHRRFGWKVLAVMVGGAALVDVLAIGVGLDSVAYVNFAFVWLFVHQLGFFYADGTLLRLGRPVLWIMAAGGLVALIVLTTSGIYSPSMVGLRAERSNTNPPTIVIIALTVWQAGLAMLLRPALSRWLENIGVWSKVIGLNVVIMTMFLWHQTAMLLAVAVLYPLGFPQPIAGTAEWWAVRPMWVAALAVFLAVLVAIWGRFERGGRSEMVKYGGGHGLARNTSSVVGTTLILIGILGFAVSGFEAFASPNGDQLVFLEVNPLQNVVNLIIGWLLVRESLEDPAAGAIAGALRIMSIAAAALLFPGRAIASALALEMPGVLLYLFLAAALLVAVVLSGRSRSQAAAGLS